MMLEWQKNKDSAFESYFLLYNSWKKLCEIARETDSVGGKATSVWMFYDPDCCDPVELRATSAEEAMLEATRLVADDLDSILGAVGALVRN